MLLDYLRRPNFLLRLWNPPLNVWMFAGSAQELKGTKAVEGAERLSVETRVPHIAVPMLSGASRPV